MVREGECSKCVKCSQHSQCQDDSSSDSEVSEVKLPSSSNLSKKSRASTKNRAAMTTAGSDFRSKKRKKTNQAAKKNKALVSSNQTSREILVCSDDDRDTCSIISDKSSLDVDDCFIGSVHGDIVGLRYYTGLVSRGEMVVVRREPHNKYDKNALRVDNTFGAQVGHIERSFAAFLAPMIDMKMIRVAGRVPCNKNTFSMPVDLNVYAEAGQQAAVREKFAKSSYKLSNVDLFNGDEPKPFCLDDDTVVPGSSALSTVTTLTSKEMSNELDKIFDGLRETDKTDYREPPPYLNKQLYPHQKNALAWMYRRENGGDLPPFWKKEGRRFCNTLTNFVTDRMPDSIQGGILADDMGLGKTIQMICLILSSFHNGEPFPVQINKHVFCLEKAKSEMPGGSHVDDNLDELDNCGLDKHISDDEDWSVQMRKKRCRILTDDEETTGAECSSPMDDDFDTTLPPLDSPPLMPVKRTSNDAEDCAKKAYIEPRATLIVCPLSVMANWSDQLREHLSRDVAIKVFQYYGNSRMHAAALSSQDVVLTTYTTLSCSFKKKKDPLFEVDWLRVVLDEGHVMRNPNSLISKACCALRCERRWVLTGTPIQNKLLDLWSLVRFLRVQPLDDRTYWRILFEKPISRRTKQGFQRLKGFMQSLAMRRTKNQIVDGKPLINLPAKTVCLETIEFSKEERELYDVMHKEGKLIVNKYIREGTLLHHYAQVLSILLRLRQICCHPFLVKNAAERAKQLGQAVKLLENGIADEEQNRELIQLLGDILRSGSDEQCSICLDSLQEPVITQCAHIYCKPCILQVVNSSKDKKSPVLCPLCRREFSENKLIAVPKETSDEPENKLNIDANEWQSSVKIDALMSHLLALRQRDPTAKSLIVSQFTSFLDLIETPLTREQFSFARLDGTLSSVERCEVVRNFTSTKKNSPTVLLLSLKAGGVGLNLMAANYVFLMEPAWNPAAEEQCFDRCHRLGQEKPVFVTKFVIKNSVEERMLELQQRKRELMANSFSIDTIEARQQRINDIRLLMK